MNDFFRNKADCRHLELFPGVELSTFAGENLMVSFVEFEPGAVVEEHEHPHEQMGMVVAGRAEFIVDGRSQVLGPGDLYRIPGGVRHKVIALDAPVQAVDVFHPPREEYI